MQICPCAFEVSRRIVLATRDIAIGHQALAKFTGVMNMRPPMNENSYRDHVALVRRAAKANCKQSKTNAVEEVKTVMSQRRKCNSILKSQEMTLRGKKTFILIWSGHCPIHHHR